MLVWVRGMWRRARLPLLMRRGVLAHDRRWLLCLLSFGEARHQRRLLLFHAYDARVQCGRRRHRGGRDHRFGAPEQSANVFSKLCRQMREPQAPALSSLVAPDKPGSGFEFIR